MDKLKPPSGIGESKSGEMNNEEYLARCRVKAARINAMEPQLEALSDSELRAKTQQFRARLRDKTETLDTLLEEAFAVVREASWRVLELRHFDVQVVFRGRVLLGESR